jgi:hypothetical protein
VVAMADGIAADDGAMTDDGGAGKAAL